jgi:hypothetical protein
MDFGLAEKCKWEPSLYCQWLGHSLDFSINRIFITEERVKRLEKSETCISGMATSSRHSHPTHSKSREEKTAWLNNNQFQNRRHKQLTKVRTRGVSALERTVAKQIATGGLNQVLGCTNLTLAPTDSHINKQAQVVLVK